MSRSRLLLFMLAASMSCAQQVSKEWYPYEPHTSWVYLNEALQGDIRHPDFERWRTEETVVSAVNDPVSRGVIVTKRIAVSDDTFSANYDPVNDYARKEGSQKRELIWQNCVYPLDGVFGNDVIGGEVPADFCFPMRQGRTWGRIAQTSPAEEFVWSVKGINVDPFGVTGGTNFHIGAHETLATYMDEWFAKGVGLLQSVTLHHGTYNEWRQLLLKATIAGNTRVFDLRRARVPPLNEYDCEGPQWRYFARLDGSLFPGRTPCVQYARQVNH